MLTKTLISLTAVLFVAQASSAYSAEDPENRIGDRYPFLAQGYNPQPVMARGFGWQTANAEDPEARIADRYPALEPGFKRVANVRITTARQAAVDVPENRLADRYPFLEQKGKVGTPTLLSRRTKHAQKHA